MPRLDVALVEKDAFPSRTRAQAAIRAGLVSVNGVVVFAPSALVARDAAIVVLGDVHDYVSRGGVKLAAALDAFSVNPDGATCLDLGASTGGFTEVLLRRGAATVYAVDVGTAQLHPRIAADPRVVNLQRTPAKALTRSLAPQPVSLFVADVSFISLKKVLPPALALAAPEARLVALIKPQFEMGRAALGKGGVVVASEDEISAMLDGMRRFLHHQGWSVDGVVESPITGGDGNREHFIGATRTDRASDGFSSLA